MPFIPVPHTFELKPMKKILTDSKVTENPIHTRNIMVSFVRLAIQTGHLYKEHPTLPSEHYLRILGDSWIATVRGAYLPQATENELCTGGTIDDEAWEVKDIITPIWNLARHYRRWEWSAVQCELSYRVAKKVLEYGLRILGKEDLGLDIQETVVEHRLTGMWENIRIRIELKMGGRWKGERWFTFDFSQGPPGPLPPREVRFEDVVERCEPVQGEQEQGQCPICHEDFDKKVKVKACSHCFCARCLEWWMARGEGAVGNCPVCRASLVTE